MAICSVFFLFWPTVHVFQPLYLTFGFQDSHEFQLCADCRPHICASCDKSYQELSTRNTECAEFYNVTAFQLAYRRLPALTITLTLECLGPYTVASVKKLTKWRAVF